MTESATEAAPGKGPGVGDVWRRALVTVETVLVGWAMGWIPD